MSESRWQHTNRQRFFVWPYKLDPPIRTRKEVQYLKTINSTNLTNLAFSFTHYSNKFSGLTGSVLHTQWSFFSLDNIFKPCIVFICTYIFNKNIFAECFDHILHIYIFIYLNYHQIFEKSNLVIFEFFVSNVGIVQGNVDLHVWKSTKDWRLTSPL